MSIIEKIKLTAFENYFGADMYYGTDYVMFDKFFSIVRDELFTNVPLYHIEELIKINLKKWEDKVIDKFYNSIDFDFPLPTTYEYDNGIVVCEIEFDYDVVKGNVTEWEHNGGSEEDYTIEDIENIKIKSINFK